MGDVMNDASFPTRRYAYEEPQTAAAPMAASANATSAVTGLQRFIKGIDAAVTPLSQEDAALLGDDFATDVLLQGKAPMTARDVMRALTELARDQHSWTSFLVADGGKIPWSDDTKDLPRRLRFVLVWGGPQAARVLVSTSRALDDAETFLQVIGWDKTHGVYNFYERRGAAWTWAGNSDHSLDPRARGKGPFDSHVNGALNMKELKFPWPHWHSQSSTIDECLAPDDPLRQDADFRQRQGAQVFELNVVRPGIRQLQEARLARFIHGDILTQVPILLRQILTTTTINLAAAPEESALVDEEGAVHLPTTLLFDKDILIDVLGLPGALYKRALTAFDFHLVDKEAGFRRAGDTHFAFIVPEPAFEDVDLARLLLQEQVITPRLLACLKMVDFPNPIFSARRESLLRHVPAEARRAGGAWDLTDALSSAILKAAALLPPDSPEAEFAANWSLGDDFQRHFEDRIKQLCDAVAVRVRTEEGAFELIQLADSRRRLFRKRPLAEFSLTLPVTNIPDGAPSLQLTISGRIEQIKPKEPITMFDPPGFLDDLKEHQRQAWSDWISGQLDEARAGRPDVFANDGPREQFFNTKGVTLDADQTEHDILWTAFPRSVTLASVSDRQRWRKADSSRDLQDEYCEWSVERGADGNIRRVTFTCEGPEYWEFLANTDPQAALELYRLFISPQVQLSDLFPRGESEGYESRNKWNSTTVNGAMHLIQVNNSLSAEIELAGGSSVVRKISGRVLTSEQELIACGRYGQDTRHSDPHIGAMVNSLTRQKADVTLANPVGIYFGGLDTTGWKTPDGADPQQFWTYLRGTDKKPVRASFEVPASHGYTVSNITTGSNQKIEFGAQIADHIQMKLTGLAHKFGRSAVEPFTGCRKRLPQVAPLAAGSPSVADVLSARRPRSYR
jgi:hypothetical protein